MVELLCVNFLGLSATSDPYLLWLEVELRGPYLIDSLCRSEGCGVVAERDDGLAITFDVSNLRSYFNIRVVLDLFDLIFKINRAVTFNSNRFLVVLTNFAAFAHVKLLGDELVLLGIDYGECMNWDKDFVSFAVDPNGVIEVLVFIVRSELNVNVLTDTRWDHTFLMVLYFEVRRLWRQDVQPLRRRGVIYQLYFQNVGFPQLETGKLHH